VISSDIDVTRQLPTKANERKKRVNKKLVTKLGKRRVDWGWRGTSGKSH